MSAEMMNLIGTRIVVRCGHIQPDHSRCGRRLASWTVEVAAPEEGGWRLAEKVPADRREEDRIRGRRVSYRCHPKRCGAKYDLRLLSVLAPKILEGMQAGRTELWLGDAANWWLI
jgi:hypothetical protein